MERIYYPERKRTNGKKEEAKTCVCVKQWRELKSSWYHVAASTLRAQRIIQTKLHLQLSFSHTLTTRSSSLQHEHAYRDTVRDSRFYRALWWPSDSQTWLHTRIHTTLTSSLQDRPRSTCRHPGPESARTHLLCDCPLTPSHSAARWRGVKHLRREETKGYWQCLDHLMALCGYFRIMGT